mmetsp:Transcript_120478/g.190948  ORF Transcript_120478/g.190948 Transcript_120478/m.190948 type:complete len:159 (-) Transcript_120478:23-499(-)
MFLYLAFERGRFGKRTISAGGILGISISRSGNKSLSQPLTDDIGKDVKELQNPSSCGIAVDSGTPWGEVSVILGRVTRPALLGDSDDKDSHVSSLDSCAKSLRRTSPSMGNAGGTCKLASPEGCAVSVSNSGKYTAVIKEDIFVLASCYSHIARCAHF